MGTSGSFGGPGDTNHLLPPWARPNYDIDDGPIDIGTQPTGEIPNIGPPNNVNPDNVTPEKQDNQTWKAAKNAMSRYASGGSGKRGPAKTGRYYVGAKGGAKKAAQAATSGRTTTRKLAGFLAETGRNGLANALNLIGLRNLVGKDIDTVFSGLVDALSDDGENFDKNIAKQAMEGALEFFYTQCSDDQDFNSMENLSPEQIKSAIEKFVSDYIYKRWLQELGSCIEKNAISETEAIKLEQEVETYVSDLVNLEFDSKDTLLIDWYGVEGEQIIDSLYVEVYSLIEEGAK